MNLNSLKSLLSGNKILKNLFYVLFQNRFLLRDIELELVNNKILQTQLFLAYQKLKTNKKLLPPISDIGFRVFSQNDEDGILLYIFSLIGMQNKKCIEIASGTPYGANTTNLICNWGWHGLLIDSDNNAIKQSINFYKNHKDTFLYPPKIINSWITRETVNSILSENNFTGTVDLLSLDLDGVDYWIWDKIDVITSRVVLLEYSYIWGEDRSVSVPYKPDFNRFYTHPNYYGASLPAFVKLAKKKGYRLTGCNKYGFNAFFIKKGIGERYFPEIPISKCFMHPRTKEDVATELEKIKKYNWKEI